VRVSVQLHGKQRQAAGTDLVTLSLNGETTVSDIIERIIRLHPDVEICRNNTLFVLNDSSASADTVIGNNDTLAFVPLFGGG
jgi:molybdopterin converting factor small subunit